MMPVDFVKALGLAILIMVVDIACAFAFVTVWVLINHHPLTMTDPKTAELSTLSTQIFGPLLFALAIWFFQRRRPDRRPYVFAIAVFAFYFLLDWSLEALAVRGDPHAPTVAVSMLQSAALLATTLKLAGALVGAWLARRAARR